MGPQLDQKSRRMNTRRKRLGRTRAPDLQYLLPQLFVLFGRRSTLLVDLAFRSLAHGEERGAAAGCARWEEEEELQNSTPILPAAQKQPLST